MGRQHGDSSGRPPEGGKGRGNANPFSVESFDSSGGQPNSDIPGKISGVFTAEVQLWGEDIARWSAEHGLDSNLAATVMQVESCGDPQALSRSGARGLFQVMPFHFVEGEDPYDPETNARRGLNYLAEASALANRDMGLAAAGYNGGHAVIGLPEDQWWPETVRYRNWVLGIYNDATSGALSSPTLNAWLEAGGASLCQTAARRLAARLP